MWTVTSDYSALKKGLSTEKPRRGALQHNVYCVAQRSVRRELSLLLCLRPNGGSAGAGSNGDPLQPMVR